MSLELSGTTGVKGVAGSVSAPSIVGDDTNTGISFPSADTIKFSTGGVERMQITNSGVSGTGIGAGIVLQEIHATVGSQVEVTSSTYTDTGLSASITTTGSNKVLIFVAQSLEARQYNATGFAVCGLRLIRTTSGSDSILYYGNRACVTSGPGSGSYFVASGCIASIVQEDSPGAGTHTYKTVVNRSVGGSGTAARANSDGTASRMILMEVDV